MTRKPEPVVIKKYANRRLYNTSSSTYVTLETLAEMVKDDIDFMVVDAKTGEELTRSVLTQIIMEQEGKGNNLLPISFMRQLISMYGDNMQFIVPKYLEEMMQHFAQNQQRLQDYWQKTFGHAMPLPPNFNTPQMPGTLPNALNAFEQMSKQNMAVFEQMMNFFMPHRASPTAESDQAATLNALKQKVAAMETGLQQMEKED